MGVVVLVHAACLRNGFVYDAPSLIRDNPIYGEWHNAVAILHPRDYVRMTNETYFRPLSTLTYFATRSIFGGHPLPFHATNLLLHVLNVFLLGRWVCVLTRSRTAAGVASLAFAVHPLNVEPVAATTFRADLLCAVFVQLGLLRFMASQRPRRQACRNLCIVLCCVGAMLSKESGIFAVAILIVYAMIHPTRGTPGRAYAFWAVICLVAAAYVAFRLAVFAPYVRPDLTRSPYAAANLELALLPMRWAQHALLPIQLSPEYDDPTRIVPWFRIGLLLALVALIGIALALAKQRKAALFALVWLVIFIAPTLCLLPLGRVVADRFFYLPGLGACCLLGLVAAGLSTRPRLVGLALLLLSLQALATAHTWQSDHALWTAAVRRNPTASVCYHNLARATETTGGLRRALRWYERAAEMNPQRVFTLRALEQVYRELGMRAKADAMYRQVLRLTREQGRAR